MSRKLQDKLRKPLTEFIMYEAFGLWFYKLNPELFKEGVNNDKIEKGSIKTIAILESGLPLDTRPHMVQEIILSHYATQKHIADLL